MKGIQQKVKFLLTDNVKKACFYNLSSVEAMFKGESPFTIMTLLAYCQMSSV